MNIFYLGIKNGYINILFCHIIIDKIVLRIKKFSILLTICDKRRRNKIEFTYRHGRKDNRLVIQKLHSRSIREDTHGRTTKQKTTLFSINGENSPGSCIMKILFC